MTEILNNNEITKLKWFNSPRQRRQKLDRFFSKCTKTIEVIKFISSYPQGLR
jgi:hypothetical protein